MALLFCDSFDHYTTAAQALVGKWTALGSGNFSWAPSAGNGRNGGASMRQAFYFGSTLAKQLAASHAALVTGFAYRCAALPTFEQTIHSYADGGFATSNDQVRLSLSVDGKLRIRTGGGTLLGTGATVLLANVFYYIEMKVGSFHATTGSVTVRINGAVELTLTNVNTKTTANGTADTVTFAGRDGASGAGQTSADIDDLYVCNTSGTQNNDFLGDVRVQAILPSADGANSGWSPNGGTVHYNRVSETAPDDDTTYLSSGSVGASDTWAYGDVTPTAGVVIGIQLAPYVRKDDAGARTIAPVIRQSGVDYVQADLPALSVSYQYLPRVIELSPATGVAFTLAEVNALEAGHKVTA